MKTDILQWLRCPHCESELALGIDAGDAADVSRGTLACLGCEATYPIVHGVPRFLGPVADPRLRAVPLTMGARDLRRPA